MSSQPPASATGRGPSGGGAMASPPGGRHTVARPGWGFLLLLVLVAGGALAVRLPRLSARPMHCDEGNQAVRAGILLDTGVYQYSPEEHHGPTLYWLTLPALWLSGARDFAHSDEFAYRVVPLVFGVGVVLLLGLLFDALGRPAVILAALITAISPVMVYYSRYYIQEMLLVFFTLAALACGWRYVRSGAVRWAVATGAALGLMHATKETWIMAGAAAGGALGLTMLLQLRRGAALPLRRLAWHGLLALATAAGVAVVFYSSFGRNAAGPWDSVLAYGTYFRRGTEPSLHTHPWYYYLQLLLACRPARGFFWSEGLIAALAVVGGGAALLRGLRGGRCVRSPDAELASAFGLFLTLYTLFLTAIYALIPYKTPWCLLSFWQPTIMLAGMGAAALWQWPAGLGRWTKGSLRVATAMLLIAGLAHLGRQCYWLNFRLPADTRNPWVYAHTSPDTLHFAARMERLAAVAPEGHGLAIHVVTPENYWPLPWYLRRFAPEHSGYWPDVPQWRKDAASLPPPAVIVLSPDMQAAVDQHLPAQYNQQTLFGLRPGVLLRAYIRNDLWRRLQP